MTSKFVIICHFPVIVEVSLTKIMSKNPKLRNFFKKYLIYAIGYAVCNSCENDLKNMHVMAASKKVP